MGDLGLTHASLGQPAPITRTASRSVQLFPHRHLNRFSRFCTDDRRVSLYFTMGHPFPPQNCPIPWVDLDPHLIRGSLGPTESSTQTASRSVQPFVQSSLVWQTDRQTRSVTIGRIYLHSTAMRPKKVILLVSTLYGDVLLSNIIFLIFAVLVVWCSHCRPYKPF